METQTLPVDSAQFSRNVVILGVAILTFAVFGPTLKTAIGMALHDDRYLQIVVAPVACSLLIFLRRNKIFCNAHYAPRVGIPLLALAVLVGSVAVYTGADGLGLLPRVFGIVLIWLASFFLCYGIDSFRAALYPLCCILLMIPVPSSWMEQVTAVLQHGSATLSYEFLRMLGVPVLRHGMQLALPGLNIRIAPECSGIHSSLALMMIAIVIGYVYLQSGLARLALILLSIPIAIIKNALRIVVISMLGAYVNRSFVDGPFHHQYGGLMFSVVGVALFVVLLGGLQKIERWYGRKTG